MKPPIQEILEAVARERRVTVAGAPEGFDACVVGALAAAAGPPGLLHIATDDARMERMRQSLAFFAPALPVVTIPAWDCLPYDRVSPNAEMAARRIDGLCRIAGGAAGRVVLTTVNGVLQRVPPADSLREASLEAVVGQRLRQEALIAYFDRNGYVRSGTVREPGEFAIRGDIVDLFPAGAENPFRIDYFGDEIETIRVFDAATQRTIGQSDSIRLIPVSEIVLDEGSIRTFRAGYREMFGAVGEDDTLYEAVSAGQRHPGVEHWLPLFYDRLATIFDYLPKAVVTLDREVDAAITARWEQIEDYYGAREEMAGRGARIAAAESGFVYKPVPPSSMYLEIEALSPMLAAHPTARFTAFDGGEDAPVSAGARRVVDFSEARNRADLDLYEAVRDRVVTERQRRRVLITGHSAGSRDRLGALLAQHGVPQTHVVEDWPAAAALPADAVALAALDIDHGFAAPDMLVITEQDILGDRLLRPTRRRRRGEEYIRELSSLSVGDLVVHVDHGIGRFEGLETVQVGGAPHDCLRLIYAGGDKLYLPVENMEMLTRFGSEEAGVSLDRLGGASWQARKARVKARIKNIADQLLAVAAQRQIKQGEAIVPPQDAFELFAARFAYAETDDQLSAIDDVMADLASGRPMDRLICGDVGFGKTEIALRAAFVAAMSGYQVAVVVPTTLLARQHYATFQARFHGQPLKIAQLSRFVSGKEAEAVRAGVSDGSVNIVIGTHALLSKRIMFEHLGLLIVDEEQHFGVSQKERLKQLKANVHVLTLTATPIPRTLQLALAGVREMSIIATPPVDRLAVRTFVLPYDGVVIREAIQRERHRGGQVFYVCPRVADLDEVTRHVSDLVPDARIAVAHGQLAATRLEEVMSAFVEGRYDILVSTNIVESGLDIPAVNTMVIHRADMFGLSQLYQLRGRIGRSKARGYCYLTVPARQRLTPAAQKRLEVMQTLDTLGAGFTLASYDLDIRGAGNLLGAEQSGHIREVGVELYQHMLEEAVSGARERHDGAEAMPEEWTPQISLGTSIMIPESYVADLSTRLGLYRRLAHLHDEGEVESFAAELIDRFGSLPEAVDNLLQVTAIKQLCRQAGVAKLEAGPKGAVIAFRDNSFANPGGLIGLIQKRQASMRLRPDHSILYTADFHRNRDRLAAVKKLMQDLARIATAS